MSHALSLALWSFVAALLSYAPEGLALALWSFVTALLSYAPEHLVARAKQTLAPLSPVVLRCLSFLQYACLYAAWSFWPLQCACLYAAWGLPRLSALVRSELPALTVVPRKVEWRTDKDGYTKQPFVRCPVAEFGVPCNCSARARRFWVDDVECALLPEDQFPTYLCPRHVRLLSLYPALAAEVRPSPPSLFVFGAPEVPGCTTA